MVFFLLLSVILGIMYFMLYISNEKLKKSMSQTELQKLKDEQQHYSTLVNNLKSELRIFQEAEDDILIYGIYQPKYSFEQSERYKLQLQRIQQKLKDLISSNSAVLQKTTWTVGSSQKEGERLTKNIVKLMLLAFNGECDSLISSVKFSNINKYIERIRKIASVINKLTERWGCEITESYIKLKIEELSLSYEYEEKKYQEKEEQRRIKEQMREEEKALREIEKARQEAEKNAKIYFDALEKAKEDLEHAHGEDIDKLTRKIELLKQQLEEAEQQKARAISQAQLTKSGHVYIISNIGSFGEDVYKIGMTRRLEPIDRVKELSDAAVPFDFDVHAMIYSEDAPQLENILHKAFNENRVNKINYRKEYFRARLDKIKDLVQEQGFDVEFTLTALAKEYRETLAIQNGQNPKHDV